MNTLAGTADTTTILTLVVQLVIPLLVGLLTKTSTSPKTKAALLLLLTAANNFVTGWLTASASIGFDWKVYTFNFVLSLVISIAVHYGIYKPTGATNATQGMVVKD